MHNQNGINRRNFLKAGALGTSGLILSGGKLNAGKQKDHEASIVTRRLGSTDIVLPVVSMGVMRADNPALVRAALKLGIVHLDTAHGYQGGKNEQMLGQLLRDYRREDFVIATKINLEGKNRDTGEFTDETNPDDVERMFNTSLDRLGLEYVDILYLHAISSRQATLYKPVLKEFKKLKKKGKTRYLGVSTHSNMPEVIDAAVESKAYDVVLTSYNFQMEGWQEMEDAIARAAEAGLGIVGMKTMAGGFLDKERTLKVNAKAALKWALQNPNIHTTIPGYTSFGELEESISVMENLDLSPEEKTDLGVEDKSLTLFCQGCGECRISCRKSLPLPDIMRAYMYTYGYHRYEKAQYTLNSTGIQSDPCADCGICTATCSKGFNLAERVRDVWRLKEVPSEFFA